jgi:hypothetical protein
MMPLWIPCLLVLCSSCALNFKGSAGSMDGTESGDTAPDDTAADADAVDEDAEDAQDMLPDPVSDPAPEDALEENEDLVIEDLAPDPDGEDIADLPAEADVTEEDVEPDGPDCPPASGWPRPACDPSDRSLVACYSFNADTTTTIIDGSYYGNDGSPTNVSHGTGVDASALALSGDGFVETAHDDSLHPGPGLTLEAWIHPDSLPAGRWSIFDKDNEYSMFLYSDGRIRCGGGAFLYSDPITPGDWTHVLCTFDGSMRRIFVNGDLVTEEANPDAFITSDSNILIGADSPSGGDYFTGMIDTVRIWNRALSPEEACWASSP